MLIPLLAAAFADPSPPAEAPPAPDRLLQVPLGRSLVVTLPKAPLAVAVTDPAVATVQTLGTPTVLQVQGRKLGATDLVVTLPDGGLAMFDVLVQRDVSELVRVIDHLVEGPAPTVSAPR